MRNCLVFRSFFFVSHACTHLRTWWMLLCASHWKFLSKSFGVFGKFHCLLDFCFTECFHPVISVSHFGKPVAFWSFHTNYFGLKVRAWVHIQFGWETSQWNWCPDTSSIQPRGHMCLYAFVYYIYISVYYIYFWHEINLACMLVILVWLFWLFPPHN